MNRYATRLLAFIRRAAKSTIPQKQRSVTARETARFSRFASGHRPLLFDFAIVLLAFMALLLGLAVCQANAGPPPWEVPVPQQPLVPLDPRQPRDEADQDRLHAVALFATGRTLEQHGDLAGALGQYQRAFRYGPYSEALLADIVRLALELGRQQVAARYVAVASDEQAINPEIASQLANYFSRRGDWVRAIRLYECVLQAEAERPLDAAQVVMQLELGRNYFLNDQFEQAATCFALVEQTLAAPEKHDLSPEFVQAIQSQGGMIYPLFAECYLEAGRPDEAERAFQAADHLQPNPGRLGYQFARVAARRQQPAVGLKHLAVYFQTQQTDQAVEPYVLLVKLLEQAGLAAEILPRLATLQQADPTNRYLALFLARRLLQAKRYDDAERVLADIEPHVDDRGRRAWNRLQVELYLVAEQPDKLLDALGAAVESAGTIEVFATQIKPIVEQADAWKGLLDEAQSRRDEAAPLAAGAAQAMAELAVMVKDFDTADTWFELAIADAEQPGRAAQLLLVWGVELLVADRYAQAARVFRRGVNEAAADAGRPIFWFYLAGALEMDGQTDEALQAARRAAELKPDSPQFAARAAWIHYHARQYEAALSEYRRLVDRFDQDFNSREIRQAAKDARVAVAALQVELGDHAAAEETLEKVLDEFPQDVGALNDLGYLWVDQKKHLQRAFKMIERAVAADPKNVAYLDSLGWAHFRFGRYEQAIAALEQATAGDEPGGAIWEHLGDACAKAGRYDQAQAAWRRAAEAYRQDGQADEAERVAGKQVEAEPSSQTVD